MLALPPALLIGFAFSAVCMAVTTCMTSWQHFEKITLVQLPLFLFSATFFPLSACFGALPGGGGLAPYRGVVLCRELTTGVVTWDSAVSVVLPAPPPVPVEIGSGAFEDAEQATSGRARVVEVSDGSRYVRLEDLDTSDDPDLHVWLSSAPSGGGRGSYDDGAYVALGQLKADRGDHDYQIPADADLRGIRSVVIWCDRCDAAIGTAPVTLR